MILLNIPTLCRVTLSSSLPSKHLPRPIISLHLNMFQSHTLEELSVFTQYLVSLRVFNPEGAGPDTIVVVMTDEGGEQHISDIFEPSGLAWGYFVILRYFGPLLAILPQKYVFGTHLHANTNILPFIHLVTSVDVISFASSLLSF